MTVHIGSAGIQHVLYCHLLVLVKQSVEGFNDLAGGSLLKIFLEFGFNNPFEVPFPPAVPGIADGGVGCTGGVFGKKVQRNIVGGRRAIRI